MTDRELMQQALVALGAMQSYAAAENKGLRICDEAIDALHARLAQPEQPQIVWIDNKQTGNFLNIAPPQREWQGLTDEERAYLAWESNNGTHCVAMTEVLLKEKNEKL